VINTATVNNDILRSDCGESQKAKRSFNPFSGQDCFARHPSGFSSFPKRLQASDDLRIPAKPSAVAFVLTAIRL
jgi:hypothetical protein